MVEMLKDTKDMIRTCLQISMESKSWSYHDVLQMSAVERDVAIELIEERRKVLAKNPLGMFL